MPLVQLAHRREPRRIALRTLGLAGTALLAAGLLAWSPAPTTAWNQSSAEATLWQLLNGARVNNGRNPLQQNGTLVSLARWRSSDQVQRNYFDHTVLGTSYQVFHWYDTSGLQYVFGGENIGWNSGYSDADSPIKIHEGFMASTGHRANILDPSFTHGGVGAYAADNVNFLGKLRSPRFFTELFMQAASSAPAPAPAPVPAPVPAPPTYVAPAASSSSGGSVTRAPAAPSATAKPKPKAKTVSVATPARPQPGHRLDGGALLSASAPEWSPQALRSLAMMDPWRGPAAPPFSADSQVAAADYRVQAAAPVEKGFFESVLGSLLGLFLG